MNHLVPTTGFDSLINFLPREFFGGFENYFPTIIERDGKYVVETDMPGFKKEDINITSKEGFLEIDAKNETPGFKRRFFSAKYSLPREIDLNTNPVVKYENGVLILSFDISQERPKKSLEKKIEIK